MMPYRKYFTIAARHHFPDDFEQIILELEAHYGEISKDTPFARRSANPIDRRLDFCACFLALIKTLDERGASFDFIRTVCLEVVMEYVRPKSTLQAFMKRLPPKLIGTNLGQVLVRAFHQRVSRKGHPDGFLANIITDRNETHGLGYGVDILECGICKLFQKHHYYKYASILCEVDEVTSGLAGLQLLRTGTIANGALKCDFRYRRIT